MPACEKREMMTRANEISCMVTETSEEVGLEKRKLESPTMKMPRRVSAMPMICCLERVFLRSILLKKAVTMMTPPLSI